MAEKKSTKKTARRKHSGKKGFAGMAGLEGVKKLSKQQVFDLFKQGGAILLGYASAKIAGKAVAKMVNKDEKPEGVKRYVDALTQAVGAVLLVSSGGKNYWLRNMGIGVAVSAVQETIETASGKSVLDLLRFKSEEKAAEIAPTREADNDDMNGIGALKLPQLPVRGMGYLRESRVPDYRYDGEGGVTEPEQLNPENYGQEALSGQGISVFLGNENVEGLGDNDDYTEFAEVPAVVNESID